jgi:hypothetical protein
LKSRRATPSLGVPEDGAVEAKARNMNRGPRIGFIVHFPQMPSDNLWRITHWPVYFHFLLVCWQQSHWPCPKHPAKLYICIQLNIPNKSVLTILFKKKKQFENIVVHMQPIDLRPHLIVLVYLNFFIYFYALKVTYAGTHVIIDFTL